MLVFGVSGAAPAMRRLRLGGAAGVRALERSLAARGVGRIFAVFFVILARKGVHRFGGVDRQVAVARTGLPSCAASAVNRGRRRQE